MPYAIDLFCGAGGMSEGIIQAGFEILFSSDINVDVEKTYVNRHKQLGLVHGENTYFHRGDVRELTGNFIMECITNLNIFSVGGRSFPDKIDAIFGGPPCQGFSRAGKRDKNDPRNMLFKEYIRVISELMPKYVIMENVEGFTDTMLDNFIGLNGRVYPDNSLVTQILLNEFSEVGYSTLEPRILDASDFGVPQKRKRVIFIAYLKGLPAPVYPLPTHKDDEKLSLLDAIGDLISDTEIRKKENPRLTQYQQDSINGRTKTIFSGQPIASSGIKNNEMAKHQPIILERFSLYKEGEDTNALLKRIQKEGIDLKNKPHLVSECVKKSNNKYTEKEIIHLFKEAKADNELIKTLITKKVARTKLNKKFPSLTVLTLPDDYISPFENRIFTVRELARLQSFDDSFIFLGKRTTGGQRRKLEVPQYTQVGNAVPPLLARAVAKEIFKVLTTK